VRALVGAAVEIGVIFSFTWRVPALVLFDTSFSLVAAVGAAIGCVRGSAGFLTGKKYIEMSLHMEGSTLRILNYAVDLWSILAGGRGSAFC